MRSMRSSVKGTVVVHASAAVSHLDMVKSGVLTTAATTALAEARRTYGLTNATRTLKESIAIVMERDGQWSTARVLSRDLD